jgi:hypothetical protein
MRLSDFYPTPDELIKNEATTLAYLMDSPYIKERQSSFANAAAAHHREIRATLRYFNFNASLEMEHQGYRLLLFLGGLIERENKKNYRNISYCLTVCRPRNPRPTILRKFHFDITTVPPGGQSKQPHPISHLQYCGELFPYLKSQGCTDNQLHNLHPWLSEPRVFFWPMSLALLLDMVFREFPNDKATNFRSASEWRNVIRENESLLLTRFHAKCSDIVSNRLRDNKILADEFYVG